MSHFIKKCRGCHAVIAQCRCMGDKEVQWGKCDACERAKKLLEEK